MCGGGESELGQVMLAYTVLFLFSAKTLFFKNCCDLMLLLLVLELMHVCVFVYRYFELDDSDDCVEPTRERRRICNDGVLSGCSLCQVGEVGISRGKCRHCPVHHTTFACSFCKVRLCKIPCFADNHKN